MTSCIEIGKKNEVESQWSIKGTRKLDDDDDDDDKNGVENKKLRR